MTALDLSVVGLGLVSPVATTARQHVFLIRAEAAMHAPRAFLDSTEEKLEALHCPVVDPVLSVKERLEQLGAMALEDALATAPSAQGLAGHVCVSASLPSAVVEACEHTWAAAEGIQFGVRFGGAAGAFSALQAARDDLARGLSAVVILALDTFASPSLLERHLQTPTRWQTVPPRLSEAAAALVVMTPALAQQASARFGQIRFSAVAQGMGTDHDDEPTDGRAMTHLVREATAAVPGPWGNVFGPFTVDSLRRSSWQCGMVRNRRAFALDGDQQCVEHSIGRVGAAAGLAHLVYALACQHHGALAYEGITAAWAISRDGTRGLGVIAR